MQTNNRLRHGRIDDLKDGELFIYCFDSVNRSLLMKLFTPPSGAPLYGVLDSPTFKTQFAWYGGDVTGSCLTYGTNWFLETIPGPETYVT